VNSKAIIIDHLSEEFRLDIVFGEHVLCNAAWTFHNPGRLTVRIKDFIAFGPEIQVREV
jgi:uncharacterized protein (DUF427 family)